MAKEERSALSRFAEAGFKLIKFGFYGFIANEFALGILYLGKSISKGIDAKYCDFPIDLMLQDDYGKEDFNFTEESLNSKYIDSIPPETNFMGAEQ